MQAGVPVWVPLVVGILGIIGVLVAQGLAWSRDDSRWEREQKREDLRWQRERDKAKTERDHDLLIQWRDSRSQTYEKTYTAFFKWEGRINLVGSWYFMDQAVDPKYHEELKQHAQGAIELLASLALHGSREVLDHAAALVKSMLRCNSEIFSGRADSPTWHFENGEQLVVLLNAIRRDLGVGPVEWPVPALYFEEYGIRSTSPKDESA